MLAPARIYMLLLFFVPLGIVLVYSLLTRGTYGGVTLPFTLDAYRRLSNPSYLQILWRSVWVAAWRPRCAWRWPSLWRSTSRDSPNASYCC